MTTVTVHRIQDVDVLLNEEAAPARLAFKATPSTMRALIPERVPGTYLLLDGTRPVYVGRSDSCLRTRLSTHNHLNAVSHVLWEPTNDTWQAFVLEAWWWHRHKPPLNQIHPAAPASDVRACPFCELGRQAPSLLCSPIPSRPEPTSGETNEQYA